MQIASRDAHLTEGIMEIRTNWAECQSAQSQFTTQKAISCLESLYEGVPGWIDMHPIGEYCIVHMPGRFTTHSFSELSKMFNLH